MRNNRGGGDGLGVGATVPAAEGAWRWDQKRAFKVMP
jgi:hypothetical protein